MKLPLALLFLSNWLAHSQPATYYVSKSNLCASGTASVVAGNGPWSWICSGLTINTTNFEYCSAQTSASTLGVSAFLSSLGVNTRVTFPGTPPYGDPQTVLSALRYLGINTSCVWVS